MKKIWLKVDSFDFYQRFARNGTSSTPEVSSWNKWADLIALIAVITERFDLKTS